MYKNTLFNEEAIFSNLTAQGNSFYNAVLLTAIAADSEKAVKLKWRRYPVFLSSLKLAVQ